VETFFKTITYYLAVGVEGIAALIIGLAVLEAAWSALALFFVRPRAPEDRKSALRLRLGRWLAVGLEFALAADILRTAIAPSWDEIGKLAAIAALRTLLNYFLAREVQAEEHENRVSSPDGSA
jgi:uncharacterized membrane protein